MNANIIPKDLCNEQSFDNYNCYAIPIEVHNNSNDRIIVREHYQQLFGHLTEKTHGIRLYDISEFYFETTSSGILDNNVYIDKYNNKTERLIQAYVNMLPSDNTYINYNPQFTFRDQYYCEPSIPIYFPFKPIQLKQDKINDEFEKLPSFHVKNIQYNTFFENAKQNAYGYDYKYGIEQTTKVQSNEQKEEIDNRNELRHTVLHTINENDNKNNNSIIPNFRIKNLKFQQSLHTYQFFNRYFYDTEHIYRLRYDNWMNNLSNNNNDNNATNDSIDDNDNFSDNDENYNEPPLSQPRDIIFPLSSPPSDSDPNSRHENTPISPTVLITPPPTIENSESDKENRNPNVPRNNISHISDTTREATSDIPINFVNQLNTDEIELNIHSPLPIPRAYSPQQRLQTMGSININDYSFDPSTRNSTPSDLPELGNDSSESGYDNDDSNEDFVGFDYNSKLHEVAVDDISKDNNSDPVIPFTKSTKINKIVKKQKQSKMRDYFKKFTRKKKNKKKKNSKLHIFKRKMYKRRRKRIQKAKREAEELNAIQTLSQSMLSNRGNITITPPVIPRVDVSRIASRPVRRALARRPLTPQTQPQPQPVIPPTPRLSPQSHEDTHTSSNDMDLTPLNSPSLNLPLPQLDISDSPQLSPSTTSSLPPPPANRTRISRIRQFNLFVNGQPYHHMQSEQQQHNDEQKQQQQEDEQKQQTVHTPLRSIFEVHPMSSDSEPRYNNNDDHAVNIYDFCAHPERYPHYVETSSGEIERRFGDVEDVKYDENEIHDNTSSSDDTSEFIINPTSNDQLNAPRLATRSYSRIEKSPHDVPQSLYNVQNNYNVAGLQNNAAVEPDSPISQLSEELNCAIDEFSQFENAPFAVLSDKVLDQSYVKSNYYVSMDDIINGQIDSNENIINGVRNMDNQISQFQDSLIDNSIINLLAELIYFLFSRFCNFSNILINLISICFNFVEFIVILFNSIMYNPLLIIDLIMLFILWISSIYKWIFYYCYYDRNSSFEYLYTLNTYVYKGKTWIEDHLYLSRNNRSWKINIWVLTSLIGLILISLFADTGASISAISPPFANKHWQTEIKTVKSHLKCRVADGKYLKLTQYVDLPLCTSAGDYQFTHRFWLIPHLQHDILRIIYIIT